VKAKNVLRVTICECGHPAYAHYDSYLFCAWDDDCDCEEFRAEGEEKLIEIPVGPLIEIPE
jgi:hypothetical protein